MATDIFIDIKWENEDHLITFKVLEQLLRNLYTDRYKSENYVHPFVLVIQTLVAMAI